MTYLIRQMGHVIISSPDPPGAAQDLCDVVGLRITEVDGETVYLSSNDRHHEVTYIKGAGKERALVWERGRHGAGGNIFTYCADPHGCLVENSIELDRIDNDAVYEPRSWDIFEGLAERWLILWGTPPTPSFLRPGIAFDPTI